MMRTTLLPVVFTLAALVGACSDDGGGPPSGDAGPIDECSGPSVAEGMPCDVEGLTCGGPCDDQCSFCNLLSCDGGIWGRLEVFPAPCFSCGTDAQCVQDSEYCYIERSDIGGEPDTFECRTVPAACSGDATCVCLGMEIAFDMCEGDPGLITVEVSGG